MRLLAVLAVVALFMAPVAPSKAQSEESSLASGFLIIEERFWVREGRPPVLNICVDQKEIRGTLSNRYECTRHVPVTGYLDEVYPRSGLTLVDWQFECLGSVMPITGGRCEKVVVLYYR